MTIVSDDAILSFLDVDAGYFNITSSNDVMNFTSSEGGPVDAELTDGTYSGTTLATQLATQMNADNTLTGTGTITFTVVYSSTTRKFTISAGAGNTIAYDHSESDAGLTMGWEADDAAAVSIVSDVPAGDPTTTVTDLRDAVEAYVTNIYCQRTFESTAYSLEKYDGKGYRTINLNNYPITLLDRVAIGIRDVIKIRNTSTYSTASVSVLSTGLRLVKDGTADSTDVTFATNATMSAMVTAVDAISGWEAQMLNTAYNSFVSTELMKKWALSAINNNWVYLPMPEEAEYDIEVRADWGQIRRPVRFPISYQNIFVDYTAGYSSANMPEDLKLGIKILVKYLWQRRDEENFGAGSYRSGDLGAMFDKGPIPKEAEDILTRYKRRPRLT